MKFFSVYPPHVYLGAVVRAAQQHIRGPVPEGDHFVAVGLGGD